MKRVLMLVREMIPSAVLCGYAQLSELQRQGKISLRTVSPGCITPGLIARADVLIFLRSDDSFALTAAELARRAGKYCVYVFDDDLLNVPPEISSAAHYNLPETKRCIRAIMRLCQCMLTPSAVLLEEYGGLFERAERIEEPALPAQPLLHPTGGPVRIGFAGSTDRSGDVDRIVAEALRRMKDKYGQNVTIDFYGVRPTAAKGLGARCLPYDQSYDEYRRTMERLGWDIGLAPLPDTPFHRCKHYNKYIEYAAFGIAGIYSDVAVYREAVSSGENGLLAPNTPDGWYTALCQLIENESLRRSIARQCFREVRERCSLEASCAVWESVIRDAPQTGSFVPCLWLPWGRLMLRSLAGKLRVLAGKLRHLRLRHREESA